METATAQKVVTSTGTGKGPTQELALKAAIKAANDALGLSTEKSGYDNIVGNTQSPVKSNTNEFVKFDFEDTDEWLIDSSDHTVLVCNDPGTWEFLAQYQLVAVGDGLAKLHGWVNYNGKNVEYSDAYGSSLVAGNDSVLVIAYSGDFKVGDKIKWGIHSSDVTKLVINSGKSPSGLIYPAIILTAFKK